MPEPNILKMNIIFVLILISLFVALGFLAAFIWAVKSGQYEDGYTPSVRMLFDNKPLPPTKASPTAASGNTEEGQKETPPKENKSDP